MMLSQKGGVATSATAPSQPPLTHTDGRSASFDRGGDRKNAVSEVAEVMVEMVIVEF